jgi:DNA-binding response OmpR family regulator
MIKILIIEDELFLRELLASYLENAHHKVISAERGEEGIRKARESDPDIILLDLILPGIDGFEVLRQIKRDPGLSHIPVLILSNLGQKRDVDKGIEMGAADYLVKAKFSLSEIEEKIKQILADNKSLN